MPLTGKPAEFVRELLYRISEFSPDLIYAKDLDGRMIFANPALLTMIGRSWDEISGRSDLQWHNLTSEDADLRVIAGGHSEHLVDTITGHAGPANFLSTKSPLRAADGTVVGMFCISMNITTRRHERAQGQHPAQPKAAKALTAPRRAELRKALRTGQFLPYYQPIHSLASNEIVGLEVLARWQHPQRGLLAPNDFIPVMEEQGLCAELSISLLYQVIEDARAWPREWTFAFNASASQMREVLAFVNTVDLMPERTIDVRRIELEVTETALIEDMGLAREVVQSTHRAGAKVVLDDFGTGYANLMYLRELPFDRIKIDRRFVHDMLLSARSIACVQAILAMARSLGVSVVAEGVESEAVARKLHDMGCAFAQGYHYSPPVPAEQVAWLAGRAESNGLARTAPHRMPPLVVAAAPREAAGKRTEQG